MVIMKSVTQNMTLPESFAIIDEMREKIQAILESKAAKLTTKLYDIFNKIKKKTMVWKFYHKLL